MRHKAVQVALVVCLFGCSLGCRSASKMFASNGDAKWWQWRKGKAAETDIAAASPYPQLPSAAAQAATTTAPPVAPTADPAAAYTAQATTPAAAAPPAGYPAAGTPYAPANPYASASAAPAAGPYNTDYYAQAAAPAATDPYAAGSYAQPPAAAPQQPYAAPQQAYDPNQAWQQPTAGAYPAAPQASYAAPPNGYAQPYTDPNAHAAAQPYVDPNAYAAPPASDPNSYGGQPAYQVAANPYPAPQYRSDNPQHGVNNPNPAAATTAWASENQPQSGAYAAPASNGQWSNQPMYSADQVNPAAPAAYGAQPSVARPYRPGGTGDYVPAPRTSSTSPTGEGVAPAVYQGAPGAPSAVTPSSGQAAVPPAVYVPPAEASGSSW